MADDDIIDIEVLSDSKGVAAYAVAERGGVTAVERPRDWPPRSLIDSEVFSWRSRELRASLPSRRSRGSVSSVSLMFGPRATIQAAISSSGLCIEPPQALDAQLRACETSGVDLSMHDALDVMSRERLTVGLAEIAVASRELAAHVRSSDRRAFDCSREAYSPLESIAIELESAGVPIDERAVRSRLGSGVDVHVRNFLSSMLRELGDDGRARYKIDPIGTKTGRMKVSSGLRVMSIPHGAPREAIRSSSGRIASIDFNAIDVVSVMWGCGVDLARLYDGCDDVHSRTAELAFDVRSGDVTPDMRRAAKAISLVRFYGGSAELAARSAGMSGMDAIERFDRVVGSCVYDFRDRLHRSAMAEMELRLPSGRRVPLEPTDTPGKVLGLYGQGMSSYAFERALDAALVALSGTRSRALFPVHDELVIELLDDESVLDGVASAMESAVEGVRYPVKCSVGGSYEDVTR